MKRILIVFLCACLLMALRLYPAPPAEMITEVSLSASHTAAVLHDTLTWTAWGMNGSGNYWFNFTVYCDNMAVMIGNWDDCQTDPFLSLEAIRPGTYYATVMVYDRGWDDYAEATSGYTAVTVGLTAPEQLRAEAAANEAAGILKVSLSWTAVPGADGYQYCRKEPGGGYTLIRQFMYPTLSAVDEFPLPETGIRLDYIVSGIVITDENVPLIFGGPYSTPASVAWGRWLAPLWERLLYKHVWPWDETWHGPWLAWLMQAYSDPADWPEGASPSPEVIAGLAGKLAANAPLDELELAICSAIHPDGLTLLAEAYLDPPAEEEAKRLAIGLKEACGLLDGRPPEALSGVDAARYGSLLKDHLGPLRLEGGQDAPGPAGTPLVFRTPFRLLLPTPVPIRIPRP